jgi:hypothetical protein
MNERQMASVKLRNLDEIENYLDGYGDTKRDQHGRPYYLKIDHCQIVPTHARGEYLILTIYHLTYLDD